MQFSVTLLSNRGSILYKNIFNKTVWSFNRTLTYLQKVKLYQNIKENDSVCQKLLNEGKFLVYSGSKPLIIKQNDKAKYHMKPHWLSYNDLSTSYLEKLDSAVLLDVDYQNNIRYSVQLGRLDQEALKKIEELGATFVDLRLAFFASRWDDASVMSRANMLHMFNRNNSFCGKCGHKTTRNAPGDSRSCPSCSHSIYPASNPVGIVLIKNEANDKALLVRQPKSPPGIYTCVAGFAEPGETLEDTVRREIVEEVGLETDKIQYVASQYWPFPGTLMTGCYAVASKYELNIDKNELEDAKWFTRQEVSDAIERSRNFSYSFIKFQTSKELIVPPPTAISHQLIRHWVINTPIYEIGSQIREGCF